MRVRRHGVASRRGMTVTELAIASTIFSIVAYGIVRAASTGVQAERAVSQAVVDARALHESCRSLCDELCLTASTNVDHEIDEAGFSTLTFQVPVETDLGVAWGAYDFLLGEDEIERNREGWHICYLPRVVEGGGRQLVRLVLDEEMEPQLDEVVVDRIANDGTVGFTAEDTGALWVLTVRLPADENGVNEEAVIHVASRN